jgi:hypothetical protein
MQSTRIRRRYCLLPVLSLGLSMVVLASACAAPEPSTDEPASTEGGSPSPDRKPQGERAAKLCSLDEVAPTLALGWVEVPDDGTTRSGSTLSLSLTNHLDVAVDAEIGLRIHADGRLIRKSLGRHTVPPRTQTGIPVDVSIDGLDPSDLAFSAQLIADAELFQDGARFLSQSTDPLYFHGEPSTGVLMYGERAYRDVHRAGDVRRRLTAAAGEAPLAGIGVARQAAAEDLVGDPTDGR